MKYLIRFYYNHSYLLFNFFQNTEVEQMVFIDTEKDTVSLNRTTVLCANSSLSNGQATSVIQTPLRSESVRSDSNMSATSQSRITGDVALTPTHSSFTPLPANPHSSLTALTPMASGSTQAKNSIKIQ